MKRLVTVLFLAFVGLSATVAFGSTPAGACSCAMSNDTDAFARSDAVFVGEVAGYDAPAPGESFSSTDPARWTFTVSRVFKGDVTASQVVVSEVSGASCGLEIPHRGEFLVFAETAPARLSPEPGAGELYAGLCGGTRVATDGALDPVLGTGHAPKAAAPTAQPTAVDIEDDGSDTSPTLLIVGAAVVGITIVLGVAFRARARRSASDAMP